MKILNAEQIRSWDEYTIAHEPVASIDLMERAAVKCVAWLEENRFAGDQFTIFCGKGNNGGDGLAIARLLSAKKYSVTVYILEFGHIGTANFQTNLARLHQYPDVEIRFVQSAGNFHAFKSGEIIIDALFGSGLNRQLEGVTAQLVDHMNSSGCTIISIDIPGGMYADRSSKGNRIIQADHTLSFQCIRLAFLVAENAAYIGKVHLLDIGLHPGFAQSIQAVDSNSPFELTDGPIIHSIYKPRNNFAHKGSFGHALLVAGSYGKMGAAVLSASACMRTGVGLLTCHIPGCGYDILQVSVPEAMVMTDPNKNFNTKIEHNLARYQSIGIGPGIGTEAGTEILLRETFSRYSNPIVLDADALNILAADKDLLRRIPPGSILTPHPKEFERLFGETANDFERLRLAQEKAKEFNCIIVLKGHHTFIATPSSKAHAGDPIVRGYFNSTGNAGMATAGSGDVLTGILTGLLAQGYSSIETAMLGVYLHGLAGDIAAARLSMEAMLSGDIIEHLGDAYKVIGNWELGIGGKIITTVRPFQSQIPNS